MNVFRPKRIDVRQQAYDRLQALKMQACDDFVETLKSLLPDSIYLERNFDTLPFKFFFYNNDCLLLMYDYNVDKILIGDKFLQKDLKTIAKANYEIQKIKQLIQQLRTC
ncbi:MAG: hypothetical protein EKK64_08275 [Neisseriaceae bacterium]|nr:MAG: hypothetical protein EKK64_08275 [Neisseriaceae bacterium]